MIIRKNIPKGLGINEPIRHNSHKRPVTRRDFIGQGFMTGAATVLASPLLSSLWNSGNAYADVLADLDPGGVKCAITNGAGKIPFIAFDLSGGANIAGSNVLVGQNGSQLNKLSTAGYAKLGIPGNMVPDPASTTGTFIDSQFGLAFHSDSAFLRGMLMTTAVTTRAFVNGCVIPAMSQNDTQNNPWAPLYGIARCGAKGQLLTLIGSVASDSGGSSIAPASMMDASLRPTKVDRASDATGLVDTGSLGTMFTKSDGSPDTASTVAVMEAIDKVTRNKLAVTNPKLTDSAANAKANDQVDCAYVRGAYMSEQFSSPAVLDPFKDANITAAFAAVGGISADREFEKAAAVMKLVVDGMAGGGIIQMGGFDYHTGDRSTGEARDFRAGICIGACLEYAARTNKPIMLQVYSDGSLNSNGMIDNSTGGRGKGVWTGDNQSTGCTFFLVYKPSGRPLPVKTLNSAMEGPQLGYFQASGDVNAAGSPAANSVTAAVDMILLNYLALHNEQGQFSTLFPTSPIAGQIDNWIALQPVCQDVITSPV
jgi:hypothetical protein